MARWHSLGVARGHIRPRTGELRLWLSALMASKSSKSWMFGCFGLSVDDWCLADTTWYFRTLCWTILWSHWGKPWLVIVALYTMMLLMITSQRCSQSSLESLRDQFLGPCCLFVMLVLLSWRGVIWTYLQMILPCIKLAIESPTDYNLLQEDVRSVSNIISAIKIISIYTLNVDHVDT